MGTARLGTARMGTARLGTEDWVNKVKSARFIRFLLWFRYELSNIAILRGDQSIRASHEQV